MNIFKLFAVVVAAGVAVTQFAVAEDPAPLTSGTNMTSGTNSNGQKWAGHHGGGKRLEHLAQALGLTDQQKTQLQELFKAHRPELKAIRENQSLTPEQKKEQSKQVFAGIKQQAQSFLTPEQQQKWSELKGRHQGNS